MLQISAMSMTWSALVTAKWRGQSSFPVALETIGGQSPALSILDKTPRTAHAYLTNAYAPNPFARLSCELNGRTVLFYSAS
jgi:hypothetical protein